MFAKLRLQLNIRQKIVLAFCACISLIGMMGAISYNNILTVEKKILLVEDVFDLSNTILEVRRYEKNYLLFMRQNDLQENLFYIGQVIEKLKGIEPRIIGLQISLKLEELSKELSTYNDLIGQIAAKSDSWLDHRERLIQGLRNSGQRLVELSQNLVTHERNRILEINKGLKRQIFISMLLLITMGVLMILVIKRQVLQPLRLIEKTTRQIAQGNFESVTVWNTRDEIQRVMESFNRMVSELKRRQDQLVQAQKLSSIGTLASGIAHQVNNPLNNISTSCQILIEDIGADASEFVRKMLTNIETETLRAKDIVKGLLEYSRSQEFVLKPHRLKNIVERSVKLISSQVPAGIDIHVRVAEDITLPLDSNRMQEVFINLLINAVQSIETPPGQVTVSVAEDPGNRQVKILVEDTGKGIPESIRNHIFDPFFTTKRVELGTGLGLFIVYSIIERHHGSIFAENLASGGARFTIKLPLEAAVQELAGTEGHER